ncbi:cell division protein ZapA [Jannaschia sp. Os4]|uniref:cell division protein ZapA n=1 Tax=Jannaschia sp. Os4 TaxID=2807617 RepID=UPI0019392B68|nr:cell division protein ZapA [Jannaschia sp. Os4]MBM2576704.1 cell division protein ZapA [Jannaschia sp. Os4]
MPDVTIEIGGRSFLVNVADGEEQFLATAAQMLDREAQQLNAGGQRLTQDRMLLMAGLMLADKALSADEELRALDRRIASQTREIERLRALPAHNAPAPAPELREVVRDTVPEGAVRRAQELAAKAETLAGEMRDA